MYGKMWLSDCWVICARSYVVRKDKILEEIQRKFLFHLERIQVRTRLLFSRRIKKTAGTGRILTQLRNSTQ